MAMPAARVPPGRIRFGAGTSHQGCAGPGPGLNKPLYFWY